MIPAGATPTTPQRRAGCWPSRASSTSSAATPPRPARRSCRCSRSMTACSGIRPTMRALRAATTWSTRAPPPTSTSCRWPSTCCATTAPAPIAWARTTSGPGRTTRSCARPCSRPAASCWPSATSRWANSTSTGIVRQILDCRPSFIFNTLIGDSAYAFFRAIRRAASEHGIDQRRTMPVASCSLAEPELVEIGVEAAAGHLSSSVYFESIDTPANRDFVQAYRQPLPGCGPDIRRCRGLLPRGASAGTRRPPRGHRRDDRGAGRPCRTSPSTHHRARCASIATTATAT